MRLGQTGLIAGLRPGVVGIAGLRPGRAGIAGLVAALVLLLACSGCKFLKDEFTFLDRAAPPAPPPASGSDAGR